MAYQTLLRIPLGTALLEEVAFRGVLFGVWLETAGARRALIGSSVAFALWHIAPTVELLEGSELFGSWFVLALGVLGGVFAAFLGGLFFGLAANSDRRDLWPISHPLAHQRTWSLGRLYRELVPVTHNLW